MASLIASVATSASLRWLGAFAMPFNSAYLLPWLQPRARVEAPHSAEAVRRPMVNPEALAALAIVALPMAWAGLMSAAA